MVLNCLSMPSHGRLKALCHRALVRAWRKFKSPFVSWIFLSLSLCTFICFCNWIFLHDCWKDWEPFTCGTTDHWVVIWSGGVLYILWNWPIRQLYLIIIIIIINLCIFLMVQLEFKGSKLIRVFEWTFELLLSLSIMVLSVLSWEVYSFWILWLWFCWTHLQNPFHSVPTLKSDSSSFSTNSKFVWDQSLLSWGKFLWAFSFALVNFLWSFTFNFTQQLSDWIHNVKSKIMMMMMRKR